MKMYANLHTHSNRSDGRYSPTELAHVTKKEGYGAVVLTDHDTASGCAELAAECEKLGIETVVGVELNTPSELLKNQPQGLPDSHVISQFHIVGLDFDPEYPPMKEYLAYVRKRKTEMTHQLVDNAIKAGRLRGIEWEEIVEYNLKAGKPWISGSQLRAPLIAKGLLEPDDFKTLGQKVFGEHAKKVVEPFPYKSEHEIIKLIRDAGGVAVIAHPHMQIFCLDALVEMGINGIETSHHTLTEKEAAIAYKYAIEKNLFISGGCDHFGLCSAYYKEDGNEKNSPYYAPYCHYGASKVHFEEIKTRKLMR